MPKTTYTQTFTVTMTDAQDDLPTILGSALEQIASSFGVSQDFSFDIEPDGDSVMEVTETDEELAEKNRLNARNGRLLGLKGWLYGEHLKKEAGLPSEWDQNVWGRETACGTSCCIAGKTVLDAGGRFIEGYRRGTDTTLVFETAVMPNGDTVSVADKARELLDLDMEQRSALFAGGNAYHHAVAIIDGIINGVTGNDIWDVRAEAERQHEISLGF